MKRLCSGTFEGGDGDFNPNITRMELIMQIGIWFKIMKLQYIKLRLREQQLWTLTNTRAAAIPWHVQM